ncbi:DHA2 family efflux MFS transporter permease subunit [Streptomyces anulatus]|uniref:DHA2 family efflux MFS transporter permease subunit n=1 Tax=Streptomyces TaxID=1883 RepID=UPI000BEFF42F|nr:MULTISPECIES: DHA2 family efflux MFS transporter permease subunit [Streptomyces]UPT45978.1 DHA2 family efflux MFS transporter permease subunit [Streptomyces sp. WAC00303]WIY80099.1 DHA2 family efflux MFS transporter permease subunit [Streptomyces anulatus]WTF60308.1 DHA2 family efflux MFS transporter permease subunit [Streptomyces anulatus]
MEGFLVREPTTTRRWLGLIAIALGVALIVVDTTIVNVIVPSVIEDLDATSAQTQWIQESYAIVFAALLLLTGRLADIFGARRIFLGGVVVFGATSVLAGLAPNSGLLIVARFLQGAGAAMLLPTSLSLLKATFTGKARGQAFAVWGSTIGAAAALGPLLGGWLAEHASWRWAFGINVPLSVLVGAGVLLYMAPSPRTRGRIDVPGALLSVAGLGLLAFGLVEGRNYGWIVGVRPLEVLGLTWSGGPSPVLVALVLSAAALFAFVRRQTALNRKGDADRVLMDVSLFSIASFRSGNIATLIIGIGEFGVVAILPLWLQFTLGYSALQAGLALVPVAIGSFVASGASFGMSAKVPPLGQLRVGLALEVVGLAGIGLIAAPDSSWWSVSLVLFLYGIGVGFATAQVTNVVLNDIPEASSGQASGIQSAFRQLGSALGIAALTTVFFTTLSTRLNDRLTDGGLPTGEAGRLTGAVTDSAGAAIGPLAANPQTVSVAEAARAAMTDGVVLGGYVAAGFVLLGLIASFLIPASPASPAAGAGVSDPAAVPEAMTR